MKPTIAIQDNHGKIPPQSLELEEAVIGGLLLERDALLVVLPIIPSEDIFYADKHQQIYKAILSLYNRGYQIDLLTLTEELRKLGTLEIIGGPYALTQFTMAVVSMAHIEIHSRIVYEKYMLREVIKTSGKNISEAYNNDADIFNLLDRAQNELQVISTIPGAKRLTSIGDSADEVMSIIHTNRASDDEITGISTGYPTMNEKMYGWQKSELTIIAARPSVGKTAFAINLAFNAVLSSSIDKEYMAIIFSLEMHNTGLTKRVMAFDALVDLGDINRPKRLSLDDMKLMDASTKRLRQKKIFIHDEASITTSEIKTVARKLKNKYPECDLLILIDYLQLITPSNEKVIREQQVAKISRDLKKMGKDLDAPIIALSQLNRGKEDDAVPTLRDLRESGAIEQDADNVMFLSNPPKSMIDEDIFFADKIILTGAKFRNGETFTLPLQFKKHYQKFSEVGREPEFKPIEPQRAYAGFQPPRDPSQSQVKWDEP